MSIEERILDLAWKTGKVANRCQKIGSVDNTDYYDIYYEKNGKVLPMSNVVFLAKVKKEDITLVSGEEAISILDLLSREE
ncbi:MAG: hypothetical protein UHK52_06225 [Bacteroidales bacterium]|nr:hypothetical protein [Bacteroidales bacterium]